MATKLWSQRNRQILETVHFDLIIGVI